MYFIIELHNEPRDGFSQKCSSGIYTAKKISSFWVYFLVMPPTAYVQLCFSAPNTCNNLKITFLGLRSFVRKPSLDPKFTTDRVITDNLNSSPVFHFLKYWILSPSLLKKHYELFHFIKLSKNRLHQEMLTNDFEMNFDVPMYSFFPAVIIYYPLITLTRH